MAIYCSYLPTYSPFEGGGFKFAPQADPKDGHLSVCVVSTSNKLKLVMTLLRARGKSLRQRNGVRFFECKELRIHTDRPWQYILTEKTAAIRPMCP